MEAARQWIEWDRSVDAARAAELEAVVASGDEAEVVRRMEPRIAFGTSGLRARMAAGAAHMNSLVVLQTAQGLVRYLRETGADAQEGREKAVIIAYDGRHESWTYARVAAGVFLGAGYSVLLPSDTMATPFVPYAVARPLADFPPPLIGIVVTASHNPAADNGFKVYGLNGAAILPPVASAIADAIDAELVPRNNDRVAVDDVVAHPACIDVYEPLVAAYTADLAAAHRIDALAANAAPPPIVYTAMHGVGKRFVLAAFDACGQAAPAVVAEQGDPDPDFPTVKFPNPEEGKGALELAMANADDVGADLILANDPDADRLAVAERRADGSWDIFNGNELGLLFGARAWALLPDSAKANPANNVFVNTVVSSTALAAFARSVGASYDATLTGFKYMGNKADEYIRAGKNFVFAYEEAIGFQPGPLVFDKDGIQSAVVCAQYWRELAADAGASRGLLRAALEAIYARIGYFHIATSYHFCYDKDVLFGIFDAVRSADYARDAFAAAGFAVARVRDQQTGYDSGEPDGTSRLPLTPDGPMITWFFDNGAIATTRASGTEPKLKRYIEVTGNSADKAAVVALHAKLDKLVIDIVLKPDENGLEAQRA